MVKTPLELVTEFHEEFGLAVRSSPFFINGNELELRKTLITEEYKEVIEALDGDSLENVAKELADLAYVVYGTATQMGIDLDTVFNHVHDSNMSKLWLCPACDGAGVVDENGNPYDWGKADSYDCCICDGHGHYAKYRDDGKVLKGPNYYEPDVKSVLGLE